MNLSDHLPLVGELFRFRTILAQIEGAQLGPRNLFWAIFIIDQGLLIANLRWPSPIFLLCFYITNYPTLPSWTRARWMERCGLSQQKLWFVSNNIRFLFGCSVSKTLACCWLQLRGRSWFFQDPDPSGSLWNRSLGRRSFCGLISWVWNRLFWSLSQFGT